jgi:hypothetical protein
MVQDDGTDFIEILRRLETPEGEFHAEFCKMNSLNSARIALIQQLSSQQEVRQIAEAMEADRKELWQAWKKGLPLRLRNLIGA